VPINRPVFVGWEKAEGRGKDFLNLHWPEERRIK
jgi:hypothetical protein